MKPGRFSFSLPRPYSVHAPIDGRLNWKMPVCSWRNACGWAGTSVCMPRSRHSSSACLDSSGNSSEIHRPLWPLCLNFHGEANSLAKAVRRPRHRLAVEVLELRLVVEGVHVRRRPFHAQEDDVLGPRAGSAAPSGRGGFASRSPSRRRRSRGRRRPGSRNPRRRFSGPCGARGDSGSGSWLTPLSWRPRSASERRSGRSASRSAGKGDATLSVAPVGPTQTWAGCRSHRCETRHYRTAPDTAPSSRAASSASCRTPPGNPRAFFSSFSDGGRE